MAEPDDASRPNAGLIVRRETGAGEEPGVGEGPSVRGEAGADAAAGALPPSDGFPTPDAASNVAPRPAKRPLLERLGMAAIALVLAALFLVVAVAGYAGGELFIAGMGAIGALMTLWVGGLTLLRG